MSDIDTRIVREIVLNALHEDIGDGDITTDTFIPEAAVARAEMIAVEPCVIAGLPVVRAVFDELHRDIKVSPNVEDGARVDGDTVLAEVSGPVRAILTGERVALNFIQRLSGIATLTAEFVEKVRAFPVKIKDTRKTTPGLRHLEKYAVRIGGGINHRSGLYDAIMIKDNHLKLIGDGDLKHPLADFRKSHPDLFTEVEAENLDDVSRAIAAGFDVIMLDNMSIDEMKQAVAMIGKRAIVEASGGVTLDNVAEVASTGVDWISVGALTSSARAIDIKLELLS